MGAWGHGNFDNDGALDLLYSLETNGLQEVTHSIQIVLNGDGYVDVDDASMAIAAGEVVALLRDKPAESIPESLSQWHKTHNDAADAVLVTQAVQAIEKVLANSELRDLWEEADEDFENWQQAVNELRTRLKSITA